MEEHDYIQLQISLAKLEIAVGKEYKRHGDCNMSVALNQQLQALNQAVKTIRRNMFVEV